MTPLSNILCPVDFSQASYDAIEKASFLARLFQSDLTLLHVIPDLLLARSPGLSKNEDWHAQHKMDEAENEARKLLRKAKRRYIPYVVKSRSSIRRGNVAEEILLDAERLNSDLIIMAAKGQEIGESLKVVMEKASCPVLAYHKHKLTNDIGEQMKGFRRILLPLPAQWDFDRVGHLESYIETYLSFMCPELVMAKMIEPGTTHENRVQIRLQLEALGQRFVDMGLPKVRCHMLEGKYSTDLILRLSQKEACDLIMMDAPSTPTRHSDLGGFTHQVAKDAAMPVFTMNQALTN
ncbi:MAG: universal stress protein [Bacteroidota bacterium]